MKVFVCSLLFLLFNVIVNAQNGQDQIFFLNGKSNRVIIVSEDANNVNFKFQSGGNTNHRPWTKVLKVVYGEVSRTMQNAEGDFETGSLKIAIRNYKKVIDANSSRKWEKNKATYNIGIGELRRGNSEEAKKYFSLIKKDSRWFYPAILEKIKTLKDDQKRPAMQKLIANGIVSGPFLGKLLIMLLERQIADGLVSKAGVTLGKIKGLKDGPSRSRLNDLDIKLDVLSKNYDNAESKIKTFIAQKQDTGTMRIALGDIYLSKKKLEDALYEFLRARVSFSDVSAEAAFKAGNTFLNLYYTDNVKLKKFKSYAKKELRVSMAFDDGLWSVKAKKLYGQLK
ncbi:MAG: hypothetical protein COA79_16780 [Planctomycetota bacterium]|nr:MAG: hypothetical protein COA79_16780 [Planctomycetota bacterium]